MSSVPPANDAVVSTLSTSEGAGLGSKPQPRASTYGQILKSSAVIAGSSVANIGLGIIRTKGLALLLGPHGFGLMGLYGSIADLAQNIAGMGLNSSGVRQIAAAVGTDDTARVAQTATVLRRIAALLGLLGAALLLLFSRPISHFTFHPAEPASAVALLSLAVFFRSVSAGQTALIQGMRRIADLAWMSVLAALSGAIISIIVVYFFREAGVVPSLIGVAAMTVLTSWWYSRKIQIQKVSLTVSEVRKEAAMLLKLGFAFMASGFLTMGAAYAIRIMVSRSLGLEAAGFYQSAWTLGGLYVGVILQAMGADFYPRLTGISHDNVECNRLVNEQAEISLLLAGPGVIGTLTFAPIVLALFYSAEFGGAVEILRWLCLGMVLQVIAWPMGFIVLAKGAQKIFFWTELAAALVQVGLAWLCIKYFSLAGAGMAFFGLYIWHGLLLYVLVSRLSGFRWSEANLKLGRRFLPLIAATFLGFHLLPFWPATILGALATLASGWYSVRVLVRLVGSDRIPVPVKRLLLRLHLAHEPAP